MSGFRSRGPLVVRPTRDPTQHERSEPEDRPCFRLGCGRGRRCWRSRSGRVARVWTDRVGFIARSQGKEARVHISSSAHVRSSCASRVDVEIPLELLPLGQMPNAEGWVEPCGVRRGLAPLAAMAVLARCHPGRCLLGLDRLSFATRLHGTPCAPQSAFRDALALGLWPTALATPLLPCDISILARPLRRSDRAIWGEACGLRHAISVWWKQHRGQRHTAKAVNGDESTRRHHDYSAHPYAAIR